MSTRALTFQAAVAGTPSVATHWCRGLGAIVAADRGAIVLQQPGLCEGSVYLDGALQAANPNANRWDYVIGHAGHVVFVEVHPADGGHHVHKMVEKFVWLQQWLRTQAPLIHQLPRADRPFRWVHTKRVNLDLSRASRYTRMLQEKGISPPVRPLVL